RFECFDHGSDLAAHIFVDWIDDMRARRRVEALKRSLPSLESGGVTRANRAPTCEDRLRHLEGRRMPAKFLARALDLSRPRGAPVGRRSALFIGRAIADDTAAGDERWPVGGRLRIRDGESYSLGIMTVNLRRVPARGAKTLDLVV